MKWVVVRGNKSGGVPVGPHAKSESAAIIAFLVEKDKGSAWWKSQKQYAAMEVRS